MIFNILGTPSDAEMAALPTEEAREHMRCYEVREGRGLRVRLPPETGEAGLNFVATMLRLLPSERASAAEALKHSFFDNARDGAPASCASAWR